MNNMTDILAAFASESLFAASAKFLQHLGVKFSTQTEEPIPFLELYEEAAKEANATIPKDVKAIFARVENTYFIGTVTDDTLKGENAGVDFKEEAAKPKYEGMFVFAVEMKPGETLKRSEAAVLVRGINRVVKQQPATVLIIERVASGQCLVARKENKLTTNHYPLTTLSVATCERTAYRQTWRPGERLGKVSILKGVNTLSPHRGHIDILESMNVNDCATFDALYAQWQKVFSTSLLTNKFYNELFNWYVWAIDPETDVYFPNDPDDDNDDYEGRDTKIIRLITRVMFVWFIRQKKLVPDWIFDEDYLVRILKDFNPVATDSGNYYNAVLQNLFFATLNRAIEDEDGKRRFAELQGHVDAKNLYRYDELYTISKDEIVEHFSSIPFVNGSLFECLDKTKGNDGVGKAFYYDGFSRNDHRIPATNHYRYRAFVPNYLFFDPDRGLFSIFSRYNFTIEENTPLEQQVALDPELLGKVFENLLGVYNPETKETARKQSGSFYTPREIVDYMVDETLISYLGDTKLVRSLLSESFTYNELDWSEYQTIAAKLKTVKILDPACGSGAFPVGMLNRIVEILGKLKTDRGDVFKLKRHIIENCIYGSDIQCIAAQITKLRFFISLIVNCERDEEKPNFGIPELPNLETKFVAANSIIGVSKLSGDGGMLEDPGVIAITEELRQVRHDHFNANTAARKRRLVKRDAELRKKLYDRLNGNLYQPEDAWKLAEWNPYDQNTSATFFDPEWMFGIKTGFDIVIGNPPYIKEYENRNAFDVFRDQSPYYMGKMDLWYGFACIGIDLLKPDGQLCFIAQNNWTTSAGAAKMRTKVLEDVRIISLLDFNDYKIFESAGIQTMVMLFKKGRDNACYTFKQYTLPNGAVRSDMLKAISDETCMEPFVFERAKYESKQFTFSENESLLDKISEGKARFFDDEVAQGIVFPQDFLDRKGAEKLGGTHQKGDGVFGLTQTQLDSLGLDAAESLLIRPYFNSNQIFRYYTSPQNVLWMIYTDSSFKNPNSMDGFPKLKQHLDQYQSVITSSNKPYGLHRSRQERFFKGEKIISQRKCVGKPVFSYSDFDCYVTQTYFSIKTQRWNLKFLTGLLNSTLIAFWLHEHGKMQGENYQVDKVPLMEIPLVEPTPEQGLPIIALVDEILAAKKDNPSVDVSALEEKIDNLIFDLYGLTPEEREIVKGNGK